MTVCTHCHLWLLCTDDMYCSWCHYKLVGYAITLDREVLVLREGPLSVWLTVTNRGQIPLEVASIIPNQPWLTLKGPDIAGHPLQPDSAPLSVELVVEQALLDDPGRAYTTTIEVTMRDSSAPECIVLQVVPVPQVRVEVGPYEVVLDDTARTPHSGRVILDKGVVYLAAPQPSELWLSVVDDPPWPRLLAGPPGSELRFGLCVNTALLRERLPRPYTAPVQFPVQLMLYGEELEQPVETSFTLTCSVPPELHIQGLRGDTLRLRGFTQRCHEVKVGLENRGGLPLVLSQMELDLTVSWLQMAPSQSFPITLAPGQLGTMLLQLDGTTLSTGTYHTSFTLLSNSYPEPHIGISVVLYVEEMQVYDGVVAFDFGTTNSCAVVWDSDATEPRLIPLDPTASIPTTLPSVILYDQLLADERKVYRVGTNAKALAPLAPESAVRSIKRSIGQRTPVPVVYPDGQRRSYLPEEIARDIITYIIGQVESHLGQKIASCVITHPSTFAPSQLAALRRVFTACGVRVDMTLHEPVAAALEYILSPEQDHPTDSYTLLVYDFGGGTTDITLLAVEDITSPGGLREITPKVLGASGRQRFGGEDVTAKVVQELCRQFNAWLMRNGTPYHLEDAPDAIARIDDPEERQRVRQNYNFMLKPAEELKISIAKDPDPDSIYNINGSSASSNNIRPDLLEIVHERRSMHVQPVGEFTRRTLNDLIHYDIESTLAIVDTLIQKANGQRPDIILLSGLSSRLPIVQELFAKRFPPESIRWAGQRRAAGLSTDELLIGLKECVARGACRAAWALTLPGNVVINDTDMQPMSTARIGLMARNADGQPAFKTVIAVGEPVGVPKSINDFRMTSRRNRIRVLENTGSSDDLNSPDIEELGTYALDKRLPPEITDNDMREAKLAMELNKDYEVIIYVQIPNREPFSFTCERWVKE